MYRNYNLLKGENHAFPSWKLSWHPVTILVTTCISDCTHSHFLLAGKTSECLAQNQFSFILLRRLLSAI